MKAEPVNKNENNKREVEEKSHDKEEKPKIKVEED